MVSERDNEDEGARAFSIFLQQLDEGSAHTELSAEMHRLLSTLRADAQSRGNAGTSTGKLTLDLVFKVEASGVVAIAYNVKLKEPQKRRAGSHFFLTKGNNITTRNPKQQELPHLREIRNTQATVRDVAGPDIPVRSI